MHVIVVGCGRVGSQLATMLSVEGHNVVVIDKDERSFRRLGGTFNGVTVKGLGFDEDVLREADIGSADAFAAVTDLDNTNLMAAEVARKLFGVRQVVARLYNPSRERTYQQLDLDYVCGTTLVAQVLLDKILSHHEHHLYGMGDVELLEFRAGPVLDGKTVRAAEIDGAFRVAAISRGDSTFIPEPETVLYAGDVVTGAVKAESYPRIERYMDETEETEE